MAAPEARVATGAQPAARPRRIIDAFTFFNELALLEYRLTLLYDHVDGFIIVEADRTFAGGPKELHYAKNAARFSRWADKITHVVAGLAAGSLSRSQVWENEFTQRDAIGVGIARLALAPDDLVIISDADEIVDPRALAGVRAGGVAGIAALDQELYYYDITNRGPRWRSARVATPAAIQAKGGCNNVREFQPADLIERGGWHLSYFGSAAFIRNKIQSWSHQEYNSQPFTDEARIRARVAAGADPFDRPGVAFTKVPRAENAYLPPDIELLEALLREGD
jgi:hypothetical protein